MGKKNKDKKGKGKEKTLLKTEKNADKKAKKQLAAKGEDDIESLIAEFQQKDKKLTDVKEDKCPPPSPRCNMPLCAHPTKEELIMFGGEHCIGNKTYVYNNLFFYNIAKNEWKKVTAPNAPPPRCAHQAVTVSQGGGQLWIFGGEFASPTQSQFYHYKDLWVFHFKTRQWENIKLPGPPSSRSGHRMVYCKRHLVIFGGFHDNIRDYKYFNDVYVFNLETYNWTKIEPSGTPPPPRSGCVMAAIPDQAKVLIYGGYSKERVKRDVDRGTQHTDMVMLTAEGKISGEGFPEKWKWVHMRQSGLRPSPRCGMSIAAYPGNMAVCFGGVYDQEEDEEQIDSVFYNEMFTLDYDKGKWFSFNLRGKKTSTEKKKKRRKKKEQDGDDEMAVDEEESDEDDEEEEMEVAEDEIKKLKLDEQLTPDCDKDSVSHDTDNTNNSGSDDIFKVSVGPQSSNILDAFDDNVEVTPGMDVELFTPSVRMGASMVVKSGCLYMYGGTVEVDDKQYTLSDLYSLDLNKQEDWSIIIKQDKSNMEWYDSDSSDDESGTKGASGGQKKNGKKEDEDNDDDDEEEDESDEDIESILEGFEVPAQLEDEQQAGYFERTKDFWVKPSKKYFEEENMSVSNRTVLKFAKELCQEYCDKH